LPLPAGGHLDADFPVEADASKTERRARILLIDDEAPMARLLQRTLGTGHDITVTANARAALSTLNVPWDVILCDILMPEMNGMEFYAEVKHLNPALADRIVFVTGAWDVPVQEFLESLPNVYLEKPLDLILLWKLVEERLGA
jgi:CheY-like chemotaxis protein